MTRKLAFSPTIIFLCMFLCHLPALARKVPGGGRNIKITTGNFRKWDYSPTSVFGIGHLDSTRNRYFIKISSVNDSTARVEKFSPVGILLNKTMIYFANRAISKITDTNRWGEEYSQSYFTKNDAGEYFMAKKSRGVNSYVPCKKMKLIYSDNLEKEARYYDDSGMACTCGNGAAIIRYKRFTDPNRYSLLKEMSFYNEADSPVISSTLDCHKIVYEYNEHGNQLSEKYFGIEGQPIANRLGIYGMLYHGGVLLTMFDQDCIDGKGKVMDNVMGIARVEDIYNENNFVIMEVNYNADFKVTRSSLLAGGIAVTKYKRDSKGNNLEETYYDENSKPLNNTEGYQKVVSVYSARSMVTDESYFDAASVPFTDKSGVHHYKYGRDSVGRLISIRNLDKNNKPCQNNLDRVYETRYRYDNYGRRIAESYWDDSSRPMLRWNGYHESQTAYNDDGKPVELSYFDTAGHFAKTSNGYSKQKMDYNGRGMIALRSYYDGDSAITLGYGSAINHFHAIRYSYDELGRPAFIEYLDNNNSPVDARIGLGGAANICSRVEFLYKGARIAQEKLYQLNSPDAVAVIDCSAHKYVGANGISTISPK